MTLLLLILPPPPPPPPPDATITEPAVLAKRADPTAVWVSVDDEGQPARTITPSVTTEDGTTAIVDGAPHDITGSVFTWTSYGRVTTSTGDPPNPTATNKHTEGAFPLCENKDGDHKPLCYPTPSSTLFKDTIYYVTWDPDFFNETESTGRNGTSADLAISIRLDYLNRTTEKEAPDYSNTDDFKDVGFAKLDETKTVPASWGFYPLKIKSSYLKGPRPHNITLTLLVNHNGSEVINKTSDAIPLVLDAHRPPEDQPSHVDSRDLAIALPITVGSILFLVFGVFLWNRKTRRIELGNVMSRNRHGYTGRKTRRLFHRRDKAGVGAGAIRLQDNEPQSTPLYEYSDHAVPDTRRRPRRDSDLGSLVDSPVTPGFQDQNTVGNAGNAFRDELRRQDQQRRDERFH
ncbi:hypothetical protein ACRE_036640 [Hapsidospora chrysogenum ATCC 11550]|uniref:Uncharacterized protein n=1 Tax=Hapsidospora chrysogenum (strain ATCC 11550 / CBS 779.69 / DSM 880 / IAM 14645 / JCM 23072 / IMI 49137) TaxID=857340 RepID=A0A086T801_HAPC1|nr:hypothetical protein ACRE_036640 [Hapsidospora chrysogenum ATCC 11550]